MLSKICWSPPASRAAGRAGLANRRCLATFSRWAAAASRLVSSFARAAAARLATCSAFLRACAVGLGGLRGRGGRLAILRRPVEVELAPDVLRADAGGLRRGVHAGDRLQAPVRVDVAVDVLDRHEAPEPLAAADAHDLAVVDGDHGRALAREDLDPVAPRVGLDLVGRGLLALLAQLLLGHAVGVRRVRQDREAALRQPGERTDEAGRQAPDHTRAQEHGVDVPPGVVVGEDRLAQVLRGAGRAQVAGGGEDRVGRVVRVLEAVLVGVDAVELPGRGHELHPADRAGRADVEVAPVVGLDLVDRGEDLPAHAVLDAGGLVDRQQERRDAELLDEEVRHADARRAGLGERDRRVVERRRAVGVDRRVRRIGRLGALDLADQRLAVGVDRVVAGLRGLDDAARARRLGGGRRGRAAAAAAAATAPWSPRRSPTGDRSRRRPARARRAWEPRAAGGSAPAAGASAPAWASRRARGR